MHMPSGLVFALFVAVVAGAIAVGGMSSVPRAADSPHSQPAATETSAASSGAAARAPVEEGVPSIGSVQVLNGCGIDNAGSAVADYLRTQGFDVKDVENAPTWNYPATIVVSHSHDMRNAERVADALRTERVVLLRDDNGLYDVVVYVGADFREAIR